MKKPNAKATTFTRSAFLVNTVLTLFGLLCLFAVLTGCSNQPPGGTNAGDPLNASTTSGEPFSVPELALSPMNSEVVQGIDTSSVSLGYVSAAATENGRLKFQILKGEESYTFDMPNDGSPTSFPLTMGDGSYTFQIMENTRNNLYALSGDPVSIDVQLTDEFQPFIRPNIFCDYDSESLVVKKANELTADADNEGAALKAIYTWITENIRYDEVKAQSVIDGTLNDAYIPNPDETLQTGRGICFDYAALAAAMLRSQGIPCKIITGDVSPENIYHAWNMVYLDGSWVDTKISVNPEEWTRLDVTFAAGGATSYAGNGMTYTERYTY